MRINLLNLMDEAKCYELLREIRWSGSIKYVSCSSDNIVKNGHDENHINKQRYQCNNCHKNFDDLTDTLFSGSNLTLKVWILALYLMSLNSSARWVKSSDQNGNNIECVSKHIIFKVTIKAI